MKLTLEGKSPGSAIRAAGAQYIKDLRTAAHVAMDRASKETQHAVQGRIRAVGLGRLGGAVGQTSSLKKRQYNLDPYGVIYARGQRNPDNRGAGALDAYSNGTTIRANKGQWLAFQTDVIQRRVNRKRLTPENYRSSGLEAKFGKLFFLRISANTALLIAKGASLTGKGRLRKQGARRSKNAIYKNQVVVFVLIRYTRRAQRFDKDSIASAINTRTPDYIADALDRVKGFTTY